MSGWWERPPIPGFLRRAAVLALWCCAVVCISGRAAARQNLPDNPALTQGVLGNGLRYVIVRHPAATGAPMRLAMTLRINSGTVDESDAERGSARMVEHFARLAGQGPVPGFSEPPAVTLERGGFRAAQDLRAVTSFEMTTFSLGVPSSDRAVTRAAAALLASIIAEAPIDPALMESRRAMLIEQDRASMSPGTRANQALLPRLLPGTLLATRFPMGPGAISPALTPDTLRAFHARCYTPTNAVIVVAGDAPDPAALHADIREIFGRLPGRPRPPAALIGEVRCTNAAALTLTDPGLVSDTVQLSMLRPAEARGQRPVTTDAGLLEELTARAVMDLIARRIEAAQGMGPGCAGSYCKPFAYRMSRAFSLSALLLGGPPGTAAEMSRCAAAHIRAVTESGFSEEEIRSAAQSILADLRRWAQSEPTMSPDAVAERYTEMLTLHDAPISAAQRAQVAERILDRLTAASATDLAREMLDLSRIAVVALSPDGAPAAPREADLLAALNAPAALAPVTVTTTRRAADMSAVNAGTEPAGASPAASLPAIAAETPPSAVSELELHPESAVLSAWLTSGVRLHHRAMDAAPGRFTIALTFAGGQIEETAATRGLTLIAAAGLREPCTSSMDTARMRTVLAAAGVSIESTVAPDSLTVAISAPRQNSEAAFRVARALATDADLARPVFERRRELLTQTRRMADRVPEQALTALYLSSVYPESDPRLAPLQASEAELMDYDAARAFLRRLCSQAPLEMAVTGDLPRAEAVSLASRALGNLPPRPRISHATFDAARAVEYPAGPVWRTQAIASRDGRSIVLEGFRACDAADTASSTALQVASRILAARLLRTLREDRQLTATVTAMCRPAEVFPGSGEFWAAAPAAPAKASEVRAAMRAAIDELATTPPTADETDAARRRLASESAERLADPESWVRRLATLTLRARSIDDDLRVPARMLAVTPEQVSAAVAAFNTPDRRISLVILPE